MVGEELFRLREEGGDRRRERSRVPERVLVGTAADLGKPSGVGMVAGQAGPRLMGHALGVWDGSAGACIVG